MKYRKPKRTPGGKTHDPETTIQRGMTTEAADVDEAETMASTGNAAGSFQEIASGTATGVGLDREERVGTGGLAAGEDSDAVEAGDWWLENLAPDQGEAESESDRDVAAAAERLPETRDED